jgi:transposase
MYVHTSPYKNTWRVRILQKVTVGGGRKEKLVEHIGSARNKTDLLFLKEKAKQRIDELRPQLSLLDRLPDPGTDSDRQPLELRDPFAYGLWQIAGGIYDQLGLPDDLLKYLVLARIALPKSKRATVRYLSDSLRVCVTLTDVYRFMDSLDKDNLTSILLAYAQKQAQTVEGQGISVVFYDVTTLYFETNEDDADTVNSQTGEVVLAGLRKKGYSKDHRYDLPQIVVGLTVDGSGFPLDFQVYEGNKYEGQTLLDGIRGVQGKLKLDASKLTVVADAGMLSQANLEDLEKQGYRYIVGARIKSMDAAQTKCILGWDYPKAGTLESDVTPAAKSKTANPEACSVSPARRLIVTYSQKRADRSRKNRERLIKKLQARLKHGQVIKKSKYIILDMPADNATDKASSSIKKKGAKALSGHLDMAKLEADARFDGLKGYVTNTELMSEEVVARYGNLWHVEKSFRISKSDLRVRPTFHFKRERVIAHLAICVCALGVLREFERRLDCLLPGTGLSLALEQLLAMREYRAFLNPKAEMTSITQLTDIQRSLLKLK